VKKVLIVTYYWPPSGGAGVQRWLKFAIYLPQQEIEPVILTVDPQYATYPVIDETLEDDVPGNTAVHKTQATDYFRLATRDKSTLPSAGFARAGGKTLKDKIIRFVRGNFFIPDPRKGWNKYAFRKGCNLIEELGIDTIITTSPPHSTQLIGIRLKKKYPGIRWIADLRDPWSDIYYYKEFYPTLPARYLNSRLERQVILNSDLVITTTRKTANMFGAKYPVPARKLVTITNGYDPSDFEGIKTADSEVFTINYTGTIADSYNLSGLLKAMQGLVEHGYKFRFRLTGFTSQQQKDYLRGSLPPDFIEFNDYCPHREAIEGMTRANVLLLMIPDHESGKMILPGKLFEYIATGNPILNIGPADGDAAEIVSALGNSLSAGYYDYSEMYDFLVKVISGEIQRGKYLPPEYSRMEGTRKLAGLITGDRYNS
jgi:glycosyltransferase involved in cell wall biosynthesis